MVKDLAASALWQLEQSIKPNSRAVKMQASAAAPDACVASGLCTDSA